VTTDTVPGVATAVTAVAAGVVGAELDALLQPAVIPTNVVIVNNKANFFISLFLYA